jgi:hypothetical protein
MWPCGGGDRYDRRFPEQRKGSCRDGEQSPRGARGPAIDGDLGLARCGPLSLMETPLHLATTASSACSFFGFRPSRWRGVWRPGLEHATPRWHSDGAGRPITAVTAITAFGSYPTPIGRVYAPPPSPLRITPGRERVPRLLVIAVITVMVARPAAPRWPVNHAPRIPNSFPSAVCTDLRFLVYLMVEGVGSAPTAPCDEVDLTGIVGS